MTTVQPNPLRTPREAAAFLHMSPITLSIWRCRRRYALAYIKVGGRVMYRQQDIDAFVKARRVAPRAEDEGVVMVTEQLEHLVCAEMTPAERFEFAKAIRARARLVRSGIQAQIDVQLAGVDRQLEELRRAVRSELEARAKAANDQVDRVESELMKGVTAAGLRSSEAKQSLAGFPKAKQLMQAPPPRSKA